MNEAENEDDEEDEYYNPKNRDSEKASSSESNGVLAAATSYCIEDPLRKRPHKEVRFKTEDQPDLQPVEKIPKEASIDDGVVGQKIAADILRRETAKARPKKSSNPFNG
jgi:hypothetical protein